MSTPNPRRVEWAGPESWTIWADEDGVHIRSSGGNSLEQCDVERLFEIWQAARDAKAVDHIPAPKPMTPEELAADCARRGDEQAMKRVMRAVQAEFDPPRLSPTHFRINAPF